MEIKEEKRGDVKIIGLGGRLDAGTSPTVEKWLMNLMAQGEQHLVLDFSELAYISSSGLRLLIEVARNLNKTGGKLALADLSEHVLEIIKIAGFTSIFSIYPTCDEAVAHAQSDSRGEGSSTVLPIAA
jgi:anti-anti-sigma factor